MSATTSIQWTNATINFWWGCTKVSPACTHCYAEEMGRRFGPMHFGQPVLWGKGKPRFERLEAARKEALKLNLKAAAAWENWTRAVDARAGDSGPMPQHPRVFVNSMSDWLDEEVPIAWLAFLLETIRLCPNLDFQLLTKRPENWQRRLQSILGCQSATGELDFPEDFFDWVDGWIEDWPDRLSIPENIWIGCTAENQEWADVRIPHLLKIPAKVRFLSCEPLCGPLDLTKVAGYTLNGDESNPGYTHAFSGMCYHPLTCKFAPIEGKPDGLHWIIAGGESGGKASPAHPDWFRSLRDQCAAAGVPFFLKQWGEYLPQDHVAAALAATNDVQAPRKGYKGVKHNDGTLMLRVGVKTAGNLLDGERHEAFPMTTE